jgi:hypothetical protein
MKKVIMVFLTCLVISVQGIAAEIVARVQLGRYTVTLESAGDKHEESCSLVLVAEAYQFKKTANLRRPFYNCELFGPVQVVGSWDRQGDSASVILEAARGGDGDHTGPILEVFRLDIDGFKKIGEAEIFDAAYLREDGRIVAVTGKALFDFCDVCDGPEASEDKLFVPVRLQILPGSIAIRNTLDKRGKVETKKNFEALRRSRGGRHLERRFQELLGK